MNISYIQIARTNRIVALDALRRKKNNSEHGSNDVLCLQSMRQKRQAVPVFRSTRFHRFDEQLAA
ncbi:MAG: hypothetical protein ABJX32_11490 [Tateyamaria sp.]|uniref:hypothetical protein n=1 Tax=Tateyamaria sp. TaxID=1929288 RepID=UPI00329F1D5D